MTTKIYWQIQHEMCGCAMHVNKELASKFGMKNAKDYYASKESARKAADAYAKHCIGLGFKEVKVTIMPGTMA